MQLCVRVYPLKRRVANMIGRLTVVPGFTMYLMFQDRDLWCTRTLRMLGCAAIPKQQWLHHMFNCAFLY